MDILGNLNIVDGLNATGTTVMQGAGDTSSTNTLLLQDSGGTTTVVVEDGGDVGIGTAAPTAKVHIKGSGTGTTNTLLIENSTGVDIIKALDNSQVEIGTAYFHHPSYGATFAIPASSTETDKIRIDTDLATNSFVIQKDGNSATKGMFSISNGSAGVANLYLGNTLSATNMVRIDTDLGSQSFLIKKTGSAATKGTFSVGSNSVNVADLFIGNGVAGTNSIRIDNDASTQNVMFKKDGSVYFQTGGSAGTGLGVGYTSAGLNGGLLKVVQQASERPFSIHPSNTTDNINNTMLHLEGDGKLIFNHAVLSTADFQVKGDVDDNMFYADASTNNIGIGTATPTAKLTINSNITTGNTGTAHLYLNPMPALSADTISPSNGMFVTVSDTGGTFTSVGTWTYESGAWVKLSTGGGANDGNGIYGGSNIVPTTTVATLTDTLAFTGGSVTIQGASNTSSTDTLLLQDSDGTTTMVVEDGGDVGIGTTAPNAKVHIKSSSSGTTTNFLVENSAGDDLLIIKDNGEVYSNGFGATISNTAFGQGIFGATFTGYNTTAFGRDALFGATTGWNNTAIGNNALRVMTTGSGNVAIGTSSMQSGNPIQSVGVGYQTLQNATGNVVSVGIGYQACNNLTTGARNIGIGAQVGAGTTGGDNTIIGWTAGRVISSGNYNSAIGRTALYNVTTGFRNTAVGGNAGTSVISGDSNVFLGYNAGYYETGSDKLFISNTGGANEAAGRTASLIYGEFNSVVASQKLTVNAGTFRLSSLNTTPAAGYVLQSIDISGNTDWVDVNTVVTGFTGTGAYTNFTIVNGIITAAS